MKKTIALAALMIATPALAHVGGDGGHHHFISGFLHPLNGFDHMLAMLAVGLCAAMMGGMMRGALPLAFLAAMLAGFGFGATGLLTIPAHEAMIAASVIAFGLALAIGRGLPALPVLAATILFGAAHGFAHGLEGASSVSYAGGFLAATMLLHGVGLAAGLLGNYMRAPIIYRLSGGALTCAGLAIALS